MITRRRTLKPALLYATLLLTASVASSSAQVVWVNGAGDGSWSNALNWSTNPAIPSSSSNVVFQDPITGGIVGVDTGGAVTIASLTINASTSSFQIVPFGGESLQVNGNVVNNSSNSVSIAIDYTVGTSPSLLDGPLSFDSQFSTSTRTANIAGSVSLNSAVVIQINSPAAFGNFVVNSGGSLAFGGGAASLKVSPLSSYTGNPGDVFQIVNFSAGSVSGLTSSLLDVSTLPSLTGGLSWNTSTFVSSGAISVIPEPSTYALLGLALAGVIAFRRRRVS